MFRLKKVPEVLVSFLLPMLLRIRVNLTRFCPWHSFSPISLGIVVTLSDARLTVDVRQSHLSLLVQLPVEVHGILQVVFVPTVVEKAEIIA
jgi:hypothetical protein